MAYKLLLADDSATIQRVVELTFAGEEIDVVAVSDGEEAIARIQAERPDVVLADIAMPKRSGYDVAAFVKGHPDLKHTPVLLLAGAFEPVDEARAEEVGCDGVLVKPFEPQQVIARVRELLDVALPGPRAVPPPPRPRPIERPPAARPLEFPRRDETRGSPAAASQESVPDVDFAPERSSELDEPQPRADWNVPAGESLDDYFDRLDAAFANLDSGAPLSPRPADAEMDDETLEVPTLDDLVGGPGQAASPPAIDLPLNAPPASPAGPPVAPPPVEPPDITPTRAPGVSPEAAHPGLHAIAGAREAQAKSVIAEAFAALLAVEEGEPGARPVRLMPVGQEPVVTEALIEEVTRRVIERLAPGAVREVVAQVVSEIAERLVREEIERIRNRS